ncbi:MAG: F0F1 ATP synthase subunit B [Bacteroidales bacterium]|nr:F0F1 ATP synthase subunit B [Bacteroidales bacterium]
MSLVTPDIGLVFWMVVIFGVVFFLLAKFGFPVITKAVQKRTEHIEDSLKAAQQARLSLEQVELQSAQMLEQTRSEQGRILQEASRTREEILSSAREQAQTEAAEILRSAREEIKAEKESALQEIRSEVSSLSVAVAEKILRKELDSTPEQISLLERFAEEASNAPIS